MTEIPIQATRTGKTVAMPTRKTFPTYGQCQTGPKYESKPPECPTCGEWAHSSQCNCVAISPCQDSMILPYQQRIHHEVSSDTPTTQMTKHIFLVDDNANINLPHTDKTAKRIVYLNDDVLPH